MCIVMTIEGYKIMLAASRSGEPVTQMNSTRNPLNDLIWGYSAIDYIYRAGVAAVAISKAAVRA